MNRIDSRNASSVPAVPGSTCAHRVPVVGEGQVVLDMALRAQDQRLGALAGLEVLELLGGQAVQPGQPVRAGDPDHLAVRRSIIPVPAASARCSA